MDRCNGHLERCMVFLRRCDNCQDLYQSSVRCERYRQVCHLMENHDGYGGGVQGLGRCDSCQEV